MTNAERREAALNLTSHAAPGQVVTLAATAQDLAPQVTDCPTKRTPRRPVHGHSGVAEVAQQAGAQVCSLYPSGRVHAPRPFLVQAQQLGLPPLPHRLWQHREVPFPGLPAAVRASQKVERLRLAVAPLPPILLRKAAELDASRFIGMPRQPKLRQPLAQFWPRPLCFPTMLESRDEILRETHADNLSARLLLFPSLNPEVETGVQIDVRQQRADVRYTCNL